uniref:Uncharacterized protein n=1 Tax=Bubo bubo TaxID=30461 RepID=A0A8C0EBW8_BUBBB
PRVWHPPDPPKHFLGAQGTPQTPPGHPPDPPKHFLAAQGTPQTPPGRPSGVQGTAQTTPRPPLGAQDTPQTPPKGTTEQPPPTLAPAARGQASPCAKTRAKAAKVRGGRRIKGEKSCSRSTQPPSPSPHREAAAASNAFIEVN